MHDETICASIINMMTEFKNNRYEIRLKSYNQKYMTAKIIHITTLLIKSCDQNHMILICYNQSLFYIVHHMTKLRYNEILLLNSL